MKNGSVTFSLRSGWLTAGKLLHSDLPPCSLFVRAGRKSCLREENYLPSLDIITPLSHGRFSCALLRLPHFPKYPHSPTKPTWSLFSGVHSGVRHRFQGTLTHIHILYISHPHSTFWVRDLSSAFYRTLFLPLLFMMYCDYVRYVSHTGLRFLMCKDSYIYLLFSVVSIASAL